MKLNGTAKIVGGAVAGLTLLGVMEHYIGSAHMRRKLGHPDVSQVSCFHCHFVSTSRLEWARPKARHDSPAGLAVSPDGSRIYIALDEKDEIAEAELASGKVLRRAKVAGGPFGVCLDDKGNRLFVACRTGDRLAVVDTQSLQERASIPVGKGPVAVAFTTTRTGERMLVANSISDDISVLSSEPLAEIGRPAAGREPYGISVSPDGSRAFVANRMVSRENSLTKPRTELTILQPETGRVLKREPIESAHLCEGVSILANSSQALIPIVKVRNLVPITQVANGWVMSSGLAIYDFASGESPVQLPTDEANECFADPSAVVADANAKRAYVASGGSDVVTVIDLEKVQSWLARSDKEARAEAMHDLSLSPEYVVARIPTKRNPRHLALTPDGRTLLVSERLEDSVLLVDTVSLQAKARIVLGDGGMNDPVRRGEKVFTSAAYTFQNQFSCRSCHPDGHVDGLSYDFDGDGIGDNLLDNRSLQGVAGTGPFKWNGGNPSLEIQCGPRFAKVLMRTEPFPPEVLKDLTMFIRSLPPPRVVRPSDGKPTLAQERGKAIFYATHRPNGEEIPLGNRCVTCHPAPFYSIRLPFNVGTRSPVDTLESFDTPHLLGVSDTAPYLHDGKAQSLEEIWTVYSTNDAHGVTSYMNKIQLNDLVEFLKTL